MIFTRKYVKTVLFLFFLIITLTTHEHHGASNHRPIDSLFNSLLRLTSKKTSKLRHWAFVRESTGDQWVPLTKGQQRRKRSISRRHHGSRTYRLRTCRHFGSKEMGGSDVLADAKRTISDKTFYKISKSWSRDIRVSNYCIVLKSHWRQQSCGFKTNYKTFLSWNGVLVPITQEVMQCRKSVSHSIMLFNVLLFWRNEQMRSCIL